MEREQMSTKELADRTPEHEESEQTDEREFSENRSSEGPASRTRADGGKGTEEGERRQPLLDESRLEHFRDRWESIQTQFVDEPRRSVEQADSLVADVMQELAGSFANERDQLEDQWERDEDVSTEDLRVALTRYRSFFDRLLSA
jgi:hypothetical protein